MLKKNFLTVGCFHWKILTIMPTSSRFRGFFLFSCNSYFEIIISFSHCKATSKNKTFKHIFSTGLKASPWFSSNYSSETSQLCNGSNITSFACIYFSRCRTEYFKQFIYKICYIFCKFIWEKWIQYVHIYTFQMVITLFQVVCRNRICAKWIIQNCKLSWAKGKK